MWQDLLGSFSEANSASLYGYREHPPIKNHAFAWFLNGGRGGDKTRQDLLGSLRKRTAPLCAKLRAHPPIKNHAFAWFLNGGRDRDRTDDLLVANEALSQLSYTPENRQLRYFQYIYYSIYGNKNKNIFIFFRRSEV